ncbi:uncharacterized protein KY384_001167 [Bacidia gigantensis]|uniref:uncharacterized protein n=1 Tax=Bacidia gigantensis TaxID=2732470 RepID=UPI001D044C50|nr:uncharacterized protein KY384_001167 [Bacidia gigantensis]KAG8534323.1 hypothetical protein KY384_001167 [Bacidia gigantensis]
MSTARETTHHQPQVTEKNDCNNGVCIIANLYQHALGIEASVPQAGSIAGMIASITDEKTSGEEYGCQGEEGDGEICVLLNTAYTICDVGAADGCHDNSVVEAKVPHANNNGVKYCGVSESGYCRGLDQDYWEELKPDSMSTVMSLGGVLHTNQ